MVKIEVLTRDFPYQEIYDVMKAGFKEREEQGLNFSCLSYSLDDLIKGLEDTVVLLAKDNDTNKILGFQRLFFIQNYMAGGLIAILPEYKREGIGSLLFNKSQEIAIEKGCDHLVATTSVKAVSSVNWHKKNGYRIIELQSFPSTNYYSYIFRKQLVHNPKWSNPVYCKLHYWKSAIQCRMYHLENGEDRKSKWLDFYKWLRGVK